jgi:hypothetical protein
MMSEDAIKERLEGWVDGKLASLPDSPDEIATYMKSRGIIGRQDSANMCPLALYFKIELSVDLEGLVSNRLDWVPLSPLVDEVSVGIQLLGSPDINKVVAVDKRLDYAAATFVAWFDAGDYPELIEDSEDD